MMKAEFTIVLRMRRSASKKNRKSGDVFRMKFFVEKETASKDYPCILSTPPRR
jgi:hypothetical protein